MVVCPVFKSYRIIIFFVKINVNKLHGSNYRNRNNQKNMRKVLLAVSFQALTSMKRDLQHKSTFLLLRGMNALKGITPSRQSDCISMSKAALFHIKPKPVLNQSIETLGNTLNDA